MTNRPIRVMKFNSGRLKEFGYKINIFYDEARSLGEVIKLFDGQMLRTIRAVRKRTIDFDRVDKMYRECRLITKKLAKRISAEYSAELTERMENLQGRIERTLFMPDFILVEMEHNAHYKYIFQNGITVNGQLYRRLSCSASQARKSTVVLCSVDIIDEVRRRLENDRDPTVPLAPSKFNAYFGLYGSSTQEVSEPRFCVVPDYENDETFKAYYVKETDYDRDDEIEVRNVTLKMNRADGMGLISPEQAQKWAGELGLKYVPCEFGVRQAFIKGMLAVFDFREFCAEKNGGCYLVDTVYKDENGIPIKADLREVDIILSESQFKLWNCYKSVEDYVSKCHKNGLSWGVPQYSPEKPKNILKMNYQFLQTLDLDEQKVEKLTATFEDWIRGVSYDNAAYMTLFLMGVNLNESMIRGFLHSPAPEWEKALVVNPEMKNDKYIRGKVRELINKKIQAGCLGEIYLNGNFQTLVSDPYAFAQHVCGLEPTGLLGRGQMYSGYWNSKGVNRIDCMRAPLTFRSEHVVDELVMNEETEKWYKHLQSGLIIGWHGHETCQLAGSDFDLDIAASVADELVIGSTYKDELTMVYDVPKPSKKIFTEEDLYNSDLFGFGSIIGSITNKSSSAYALIDNLNKDTDEYRITHSRLVQCCKAQSCQIDKTKIGKEVKGIPQIWTRFRHVDDEDPEDIKADKKFHNSILLDRYPYFFIYRYPECRKEYNNYKDRVEISCKQKFGLTLEQLELIKDKNDEQKQLLENYYRYMPVIISNSPMNLICRRIEKISKEIQLKTRKDEFDYSILKYDGVEYTKEEYKAVAKEVRKYIQARRSAAVSAASGVEQGEYSSGYNETSEYQESEFLKILPDVRVTINILVDYFYRDHTTTSRDLLWGVFGRYIVEHLKGDTVNLPLPDENGEIEYMGERYSMTEIKVE